MENEDVQLQVECGQKQIRDEQHPIFVCVFMLIMSTLLTACYSEEESTEVEICLDQGGEWQGECVYEGEKCLVYASCSKGDSCPCMQWGIKE